MYITLLKKLMHLSDIFRRYEDSRHKMGIGEFASRLGEAMLFVEAIQVSCFEILELIKSGLVKK